MVWNADHTFKVNEAQPGQKARVRTARHGTRPATYSSVFSEAGDDTNCPYIAQGWLWEEYGMPVTHYVPDPVGPQGANDSRYLSSQTYIGGSLVHTSLLDPLHIVFPVTGNPLRSRYANYEINTTARQERTSRDVYEDDAGCSGATCYTITYGSSSDLFGRYRQLSRSSNFPVGPGTVPAITTFTNYIAPNLADPLWLHGLYTEKCSLAEPALDTTPASNCFGLVGTNPFLLPGVDFTSEQFNFNSKGFLLRHRILAGSALRANDVLQVFDADSLGNNTLERYYGGDKQSIDHANPLPVLPLPSTPVYSITNTYSKG